ncbi:hypothetical protein [Massilia cavernae]|uniref:Porin n=1 Tax=Massilia cavernae TaxID=2320864 RepID=A0A418X795_9BURK|nr:hypothetical protein [Massilia cavernae]RJG08233.1 hypothetical protein D3872_24875 [Massilia cavernae]
MQQQVLSSRPSIRPAVLALGAAIAFLCASARAGDLAYPNVAFSGFGSVGLTHASIRSADFTSSIMKSSGAGRTERWSPDVDSRLGAQLDLTLNKELSAVVQAVSEQRKDGSYKPAIEWANVKYQVSPDLSLRAGRIALPIFLAADYRKVGYAYPWVRTPVEVYNAIPLTSSDGVDANYRWNLGSVKNATQVFYGRTKKDLWDNATVEAHGIAGLSHTTSYGDASVRMSFLTANLTIDLARELFDAYRQFGPQGVAIADRFDIAHRRTSASSIGVNYDPGKWFAMAELGRIKTGGSYAGDSWTGYASAGFRSGDLTPYVAYAMVDPDSAIADPGIALDTLPASYRPLAATANGYLQSSLATIAVQSTVTVGTRWDLAPGMALKVQYDRVSPTDGSRGTLVNVDPGRFRSGQPFHVASAVLDFVF